MAGDHALALSGTDAASAMQNVAASAAFNAVKEQVSHFTENSKVLVGVLDEIGKAHPFILSLSFSCLCSLLSSAELFVQLLCLRSRQRLLWSSHDERTTKRSLH